MSADGLGWILHEMLMVVWYCRQVMTTLLDVPNRFDWKACAQTEDEDKEDAAAFKAAFAPFDGTS